MTDELEHQEKPPQGKTERALVRASERDRFKTAPQHRRDLITEGTRLSVSTIKRCLKEGNLNGRVAIE